jgi:hypothetical protein
MSRRMFCYALATATVLHAGDSLFVRETTTVAFDFGGKLLPRWVGGAALVIDQNHSASPIIRAFDRKEGIAAIHNREDSRSSKDQYLSKYVLSRA